MTAPIAFRPTDELSNFIERLVEIGDYANQSEVIREGLRLLQEQRAASQLETLRELLVEGEQSGDVGELDISAIKRKARHLAGVGASNAQAS